MGTKDKKGNSNVDGIPDRLLIMLMVTMNPICEPLHWETWICWYVFVLFIKIKNEVKVITNQESMGTSKCEHFLRKNNNCEICKKSRIHGHLEIVVFPLEIYRFRKVDRHIRNEGRRKSIYLHALLKKHAYGDQRPKRGQSNFDGNPCRFWWLWW